MHLLETILLDKNQSPVKMCTASKSYRTERVNLFLYLPPTEPRLKRVIGYQTLCGQQRAFMQQDKHVFFRLCPDQDIVSVQGTQ
jgi:hypothetical protein